MRSSRDQKLPLGCYAIVVNSLNLGGAEHQAYYLARSLRVDFGRNTEIWSLDPKAKGQRLLELCNGANIPVRVLPKLNIINSYAVWPSAVLFAFYLRLYRVTVLLPFSTYPNFICGLSWRWGGAKLCLWNQRDEGKGFLGRPVEHWALKRVKYFVANSPSSAKALLQQGVSDDQIRIIHNGVELSPVVDNRSILRHKLGIDLERFTACMVSTLSRHKDHATLLRAWRIVVDSNIHNPPLLLLAGRPFDATQEIHLLTEQLHLQSFVHFLGEVEDISGLLEASDIGLYSSISEGMPNAVLEYMAAGLPIITSDLPGTREILGDAADSCSFPAGDAGALAERIQIFMSRLDLYRIQAEKLRNRALNLFTPKQMALNMLNYIYSACPSLNQPAIQVP